MLSRALRAGVMLVLLLSAGCAHSSASSDNSTKPLRVIPPRPAPSSQPLRFRTTSRNINAVIEVPVDSTGRPDIIGMKVMGTISDITRRDITEWLESTTFVPARQGGLPVPGVFRMDLKLR